MRWITVLTYTIRRLLLLPVLLIGISLLVFTLLFITPSNVAYVLLGPEGSQAQAEALSEKYGLNDPVFVQYFRWLGKVVRGDLGTAFVDKRPVSYLIFRAFPATLRLMVATMIVVVIVSFFLGVISALRPNSWIDFLTRTFALIGISTPSFWFGMIAILVFAYYLDLFPAGGGNSLRHVVLPALVMGLRSSALSARLIRSNLIEVLGSDYVRTARAKGLSEFAVIRKHALRNSMLPVFTVLGLEIGYLIGGTVAIETVFAYNGLGLLTWNRMFSQDFPVILGTILFFSFFFVIVNLIVDLSYGLFDPRIRYN
ncbi:ABC transporter permease [Candidatus Bipolaricaulota bacterium]